MKNRKSISSNKNKNKNRDKSRNERRNNNINIINGSNSDYYNDCNYNCNYYNKNSSNNKSALIFNVLHGLRDTFFQKDPVAEDSKFPSRSRGLELFHMPDDIIVIVGALSLAEVVQMV